MIKRFSRFPAALASRARNVRVGDVPVLLAHPDWERPAPVVVWLHGRTVSKELDPGRYLRWLRAGMAACAIDLPGHGEREDKELHSPRRTLDLLEQVIPEIDQVVHELGEKRWGGVFDLARVGIGGMSGGGMAVLRRLCDPHRFVCAAVEGTTGNLAGLYHPESGRPWPVSHPEERVRRFDPMQNLERWRPIPLLVVHSEGDRLVPWATQLAFVERLREHYASAGADAAEVEVLTWAQTGAAEEHMGFGRYSNDAKSAQTAFFQRWFGLV